MRRGKNEACLTAYRECHWPEHFLHTGDRPIVADVLIDVDDRRRNSGEGMMRGSTKGAASRMQWRGRGPGVETEFLSVAMLGRPRLAGNARRPVRKF
jgi:hypothetical protein